MHTPNPILTVSQLNKHIKTYLEQEIGEVSVEGELSNLSKPSSGHLYFTLKDKLAQIRCVFFKNRHQRPLCANLKDGQSLIAKGRLSLYEARGDYQLIVEELTEAGLGALYQEFEALKNKLSIEGLFNPERKKLLPKFPRTIGLITSSSGAAIQDILATLAKRFPLAPILIYPSEVQGATAAAQLVVALKRANSDNRCDVLILARGGGSIEDLWAFNNEQLARQIGASSIPIISGVGHETDFTIADFVADYRAETPTAAAIAATPNSIELVNLIYVMVNSLHKALLRQLDMHHNKLNHLIAKITSPKQNLSKHWQTVDYLERQLCLAINSYLSRKHHQLSLYSAQLQLINPSNELKAGKARLAQLILQLNQSILAKMNHLRYQLNNILSTLNAISPLATLERGYSISTKNKSVLYTTEAVDLGDVIEVRLAQGHLTCSVINKCSTN
jgi:exodeoxyribonuclease VII large subunit